MRLEGGDANMLFGTKYLPIISNDDPIIGKLIRLAYRIPCLQPGTSAEGKCINNYFRVMSFKTQVYTWSHLKDYNINYKE